MIRNVIRNRTVAILLHGSSVQTLEDHIEEFKDYDICWSALGNFPVFEKYLLTKIGKQLDFIFDMATVPHARWPLYEPIRKGRIQEFLNRSSNNVWLTSWGMIRDQWEGKKPDKCELVDSFFPQDDIPKYMDVPNSVTLHIASALYGGTSKIIIFGMDGYNGALHEGYKFCYKPDETLKERHLALGQSHDAGINRDSETFDKRFTPILEQYRKLWGNKAFIYNCSPKSMFTSIPKISYDKLKEII